MVQNGLTGTGRSRKRHSMKSTYSKKNPRLEIQYLTTSHSLLKLQYKTLVGKQDVQIGTNRR